MALWICFIGRMIHGHRLTFCLDCSQRQNWRSYWCIKIMIMLSQWVPYQAPPCECMHFLLYIHCSCRTRVCIRIWLVYWYTKFKRTVMLVFLCVYIASMAQFLGNLILYTVCAWWLAKDIVIGCILVLSSLNFFFTMSTSVFFVKIMS